MSFKHLFTPHQIRGLEISNRIYSTAHQTIMAAIILGGWLGPGTPRLIMDDEDEIGFGQNSRQMIDSQGGPLGTPEDEDAFHP